MRILYVVRRFPKVTETFVVREIEELVRQGDDVQVCALLRPRPENPRHPGWERLSASVLYRPEGPATGLSLAAAAARALITSPRRSVPALAWCAAWAWRERKLRHLSRFFEAAFFARRVPRQIDHIHAHFAHDAASVALVLSRLTSVPFSFTGHAKDVFTTVRPALLAAKASEASVVVAVSDYTRRFIAERIAPEDRHKVVVVRNGVSLDPLTKEGPSDRQEAPGEPPVVLSVARLVEKKGIGTLIEACGLLRERGIDVRCEVIGEGPLRPSLERLVDDEDLTGRVVLRGSQPASVVQRAYRGASVFVLPCRRARSGDLDGLPVSIVEAMAAGVPVVTTAVSGIPEAVHDGESGLLVPPDDPSAVATAVARMLREPGLHDRMVQGGLDAAKAFDLPECVRTLRRMFGEAA